MPTPTSLLAPRVTSPGPAEVERDGVALEGVAGNDRAGRGVAVGLGPALLLEVRVRSAPEVDAAFVGHERVVDDDVVAAVIDVDAAPFEAVAHLAVALEVIAGDERFARVAGPDAADGVADDPVLQILVAEGEGVLDAVGRGIGKIVADEQIVGVAAALVPFDRMLADLADGLAAGKAEEAVAAVRHRVLGEDVLVVLLEHEDPGRILPAVVDAMAVAADAEIDGVAADDVARAPPQGDAPAGVEREVVVVDLRARDAVQAQRVLAVPDPRVADGHAGGLLDIDGRGVVGEPLLLVVVVAEEPVAAILGHGRGLQVRPPVVRSVDALEHEAVGLGGPKAAPKPADPRPADGHPRLPVQANAEASIFVGPRLRRRPAEDGALGEFDLDVRRADLDHPVAVGVGMTVPGGITTRQDCEMTVLSAVTWIVGRSAGAARTNTSTPTTKTPAANPLKLRPIDAFMPPWEANPARA